MENCIREIKKGEVIFREGDFEMCMYDLREGRVAIYANYDKADEKLLTELTAQDGGTFGEMGLIDEMPRSATAVALEDCRLLVITAETFDEYFRENPESVLAVMKNMSKRIRALTGDYLNACRAVAEAVSSEKSGKEKSSWFKRAATKFIKDYEIASTMTNTGSTYYRHYYMGVSNPDMDDSYM